MAHFEEKQETLEEDAEVNPESEIEEGTVEETEPSEEISSEESSEDELTPEQLEESAGVTEPQQAAVQQPKQFYTAEEMRNLDPETVDTSRIPPEQVAFYKSMLAGFTRNHQKRLDEIKRQQAQATPQSQRQPANIYEAFDQNPQGVMAEIRSAIYQKKEADPFDPDIVKLERVRDELVERGFQHQQQRTEIDRLLNHVSVTIVKEIPDFETKKEELNSFAAELGFSMDEINMLTNPLVTGALAPKLTIALNRMHQRLNEKAGTRNLERKKVKTAPKVLSAGKGITKAPEKDWTQADAIASAGKHRIVS